MASAPKKADASTSPASIRITHGALAKHLFLTEGRLREMFREGYFPSVNGKALTFDDLDTAAKSTSGDFEIRPPGAPRRTKNLFPRATIPNCNWRGCAPNRRSWRASRSARLWES
jgi:hypothetical protein